MKLRIDPSGRIVVPKPIRDRYGLEAGTDLEVTETPEGILVQRVEREPRLVNEGKLLVHTSRLPTSYDPVKAIDEARRERIREIWSR